MKRASKIQKVAQKVVVSNRKAAKYKKRQQKIRETPKMKVSQNLRAKHFKKLCHNSKGICLITAKKSMPATCDINYQIQLFN